MVSCEGSKLVMVFSRSATSEGVAAVDEVDWDSNRPIESIVVEVERIRLSSVKTFKNIEIVSTCVKNVLIFVKSWKHQIVVILHTTLWVITDKVWDFARGSWLSIKQHPVTWFSKSI